MSLKQNTVIQNQMPLKFMAGSTIAGERAGWDRTDRLNVFTGAGWSQYFGFPPGHLAPTSWLLPIKSGGLDTHLFGTSILTGNVAGGKSEPCSSSGLGTLTGTGQLVVSGSTTMTGSSIVIGAILAKLEGSSTIAGNCTVTGTLVAIGYANINATGVGTCTLTSYAVGYLGADITPFTELSPENLAIRVWNHVLDAGYTAEEGQRLLLSFAAGSGNGLEGTTHTFKSLDGTKNRITANYVAGTRTITSLDVA